MSSTYYTSLSGMMAASFGLQNTSNNIANMQSPGFKRQDVFYSSLGNGSNHEGLGSGVYVSGHSSNFSQGNYMETTNPSDLAIVGNGFFIVKLKNGELLYTRDGEFTFNKDGILIDKHSAGIVQGTNKNGALVPISQFGPKLKSGNPTHHLDLKGEFIIIKLENSTSPNPESKYEHIHFSVNIFDKQGRTHTVNLELESPHTPADFEEQRHWELLSATCSDASITFDAHQTLEFENENNFDGGAAKKDNNSLLFHVNGDQAVTLNFGDFTQDRESGVRLYNKDQTSHTNTHIEEKKQDGYGFGKQIGFSFDDNGQISYEYDNGQSEKGLHVALALFDDLQHSLIPAHDNLFRVKQSGVLQIGRANQKNFGSIQPKKLEASNVDSSNEFANIVVLQRMFQACSQIMDIDKQLLEELYKK